MKHNSNFKYDLEFGKVGEQVVADIVAGDRTEVKSERDIWVESGNHFVETQSRGKPSGIMTTESKYWAINFYKNNKFVFNISVSTSSLKRMILEDNKYRRVPGGDANTSWGVLVPIVDIIKKLGGYIDD